MVMLVEYFEQLRRMQEPAIQVNIRLLSRSGLVVVSLAGVDIMIDTWSDNIKRS